ncbi:MAG: DedA family protein [Anaerobacillus sp.]
MSLDFVVHQLQSYSYWIIILVLFCGIIGIPAPEETFLVFIGMIVAKGQLHFVEAVASAIAGTSIAMIVGYMIGRKLGDSFVHRFGKYLKITDERWSKAVTDFRRSGKFLVIVAFYLPGLRQLSPYMAGASRYAFLPFVGLSLLGSLAWGILFIAGGFFIGDRVPLSALPWIGAIALLAFLLFAIKKYK